MKEIRDYFCPECGHKLTPSGYAWSGRNKVKRWRCMECGRTTILPKGCTKHIVVARKE